MTIFIKFEYTHCTINGKGLIKEKKPHHMKDNKYILNYNRHRVLKTMLQCIKNVFQILHMVLNFKFKTKFCFNNLKINAPVNDYSIRVKKHNIC